MRSAHAPFRPLHQKSAVSPVTPQHLRGMGLRRAVASLATGASDNAPNHVPGRMNEACMSSEGRPSCRPTFSKGPPQADTEAMGLHPSRDRPCLRPAVGRPRWGRASGAVYARAALTPPPIWKALLSADPNRLKSPLFRPIRCRDDPRLSRVLGGGAALLHAYGVRLAPHLHRPARPQGPRPRASGNGNSQAAADQRLGRARVPMRHNAKYAASDVVTFTR